MKTRYAVVGTSKDRKVIVGLTDRQDLAEVWALNLRKLADDSDASWLRFSVYDQQTATKLLQAYYQKLGETH